MALPASDDFAGTGALSGNWTVSLGSASRVSGQWLGGSGTENTSYWTGDAFGNDQYGQILMTAGGGNATGPMVRSNGTTQYVLIYNNASDGIYKLNGTSYTLLQSLSALAAGPHTIKLTVTTSGADAVLTAFVDTIQVGTITDTTGVYASGSAGIYSFGSGAGTYADDFLADTIGGGTPPPKRMMMLGVG